MRNVILYIAMSLDGYLADANGGVAWLDGDGSDSLHPGSYEAFSETVDTVLMGYRTYRQIVTELSPETWPYCGKTTYVWTHRELPLKLIAVERYNGMAELRYQRRKPLEAGVGD